ncbi:hypothetical protein ACNQRO_31085, partial [Pseudomonas aeruginosa]
LPGTEFEGKTLVESVKSTSGANFNNAPHETNHTLNPTCRPPHITPTPPPQRGFINAPSTLTPSPNRTTRGASYISPAATN